MTRNGIIALVAGVAVAIAAGIWISGLVISNVENRDAPASAEARVGGPFTLVNEAGETVTEADFRGRYMLIYFGFTFCPDVCVGGLHDGPFLHRLPDGPRRRISETLRARHKPGQDGRGDCGISVRPVSDAVLFIRVLTVFGHPPMFRAWIATRISISAASLALNSLFGARFSALERRKQIHLTHRYLNFPLRRASDTPAMPCACR